MSRMKRVIVSAGLFILSTSCLLADGDTCYFAFDEAITNESSWAFVDIKFYQNKENNA